MNKADREWAREELYKKDERIVELETALREAREAIEQHCTTAKGCGALMDGYISERECRDCPLIPYRPTAGTEE